MTRKFWIRLCLVAAMSAMAACTSSDRTSSTTGEYVDDAAITAKVKQAIVADNGLKGFQISVETFKNVVQLSGFVDNAQTKAQATQVAAAVPGVRQVRNDLIVK